MVDRLGGGSWHLAVALPLGHRGEIAAVYGGGQPAHVVDTSGNLYADEMRGFVSALEG